MDALVKAFDEFAVKVKEMADALAEAFGFGLSVSENKRKKSLSSPARYGMSLRKSRRESFVKQYSYRPTARKDVYKRQPQGVEIHLTSGNNTDAGRVE